MKAEDIPYKYAHCYATETQCVQAGHCLHRHAARQNEKQPKPYSVVLCITPTYVAQVAAGESCKHYRPDTLFRYARGMKRLFDVVPRSLYPQVRKRVMQVFSCERIFYYAQKGEYLISPKEQERINSIFTQAGLPTPLFDEYVTQPDWKA